MCVAHSTPAAAAAASGQRQQGYSMRAVNAAAERQQSPEAAEARTQVADASESKRATDRSHELDKVEPHGDEQRERMENVGEEHAEQQGEAELDEDVDDDVGDDVDDDGDNSALKKAARAGIRLLEENAQLAEEVQQLQLQLVHGDDHAQELRRMLEEKDVQMEQLTQHLRESICENQSILSELNQMREQSAGYKDMLLVQQQQLQRSPRKRNARNASPKRTNQQQQQLLSAFVLDEAELSSPTGVSDEPTAAVAALRVTTNYPPTTSDESHTTGFGAAGSSSLPSPVGPISPKRRQAARLEEVEAKFEEAHRRNSILKRELTSAQKKVNELKPLNAQLHEAREEVQVLRAQIEKLEAQLQVSLEERAEESALIQSLRTTIEIYQSLDDPSRSAKHQDVGVRRSLLFAESDDSDQARRLSRMRRRKSDGCVVSQKPPICQTGAADDCFHTRDDSDAVLESLDGLADQLLSLKQQETLSQPNRSSLAKPLRPDASTADGDTSVCIVDSWPRARFLEQQVSVLQDLLKRYRAQWRQSAEKRRSVEMEKENLLSRVDALNALIQRQCEHCMRANEELTQESEAWKAAACAYETLLRQATDAQDREDEVEAEHVCFSILRRLVDSWTADKSKRMKLHDWLTNAIRSTGKRKPLYLPDLTDEIASGFQMLLVPILRQKFGVDVQIEKRLRNVVVTDLKLHVAGTDSEKAKACLQRISRSLMWLVDVEAAQLEENEWLGEFARKKAARMCRGK